MAIIKAFIKEVKSKAVNGKTFYNSVMSTGETVGWGMFPPKLREGEYVEFSAETNERGYLQGDKKSFKVLEAPKEAISTGASAASVARSSVVGKDDYWKGKEARDVVNDKARNVGAARNTAIEWIKFLDAKGALPNITTKAKKEDLEGLYNEALDLYTKKFMISEEKNNKDGTKTEDATRAARGSQVAEPAGAREDDGDWNA